MFLEIQDVITINSTDYGGPFDAVITSMKINPDFSIKLSFTRFTDDLDDWGDLSPGAVTIGEDDDTIVYSPVISGPSKGTVGINDPNVFQHPIYYFGNRGDGTKEELCSIGIDKSGADYIIGFFGSTTSTRIAIKAVSSTSYAIWAKANNSSYALLAENVDSTGIGGFSSSEFGVVGASTSSFGGWFSPKMRVSDSNEQYSTFDILPKGGALALWSYANDSLADDGTHDLPDATSGFIFISCNAEYGGWAIQNDGTVTKMWGSANTANTDSDTDLCVYQSGTQAIIKNRLGAAGKIRSTYFYN